MTRIGIAICCMLFSTALTAAEQSVDAEDQWEQQRLRAEALYKARTEGARLYKDKKYEEALPHLNVAAKGGFKTSQAQLGFMHLSGLGGAEKDTRIALGWLGAAADGVTDPDIKKYFKDTWKKIPREHQAGYQRIVDQFIGKYGAEANNVKCERANKRGSRLRELRCMLYDPDGRLITDTLADLEPGFGSQQIDAAGSAAPGSAGGPGGGGGGGGGPVPGPPGGGGPGG